MADMLNIIMNGNTPMNSGLKISSMDFASQQICRDIRTACGSILMKFAKLKKLIGLQTINGLFVRIPASTLVVLHMRLVEE